MPSAEKALRVFQVSSTIAAIGFTILIVQTILAKYRLRKRQAKANGSSVLPAVISGDELKKPTTADVGPVGSAREESDQAWKKPLHDRIDALMLQARTPVSDDSTREIARAAAAYLLAAESLLRLRRRAAGGAKPRRTLAELHAAASQVVRDTTAATASLQDLGHPDKPESVVDRDTTLLLTGAVSFFAAWVAFGAAMWAELSVFDGELLDLTSFTLRGEPRRAGPPPHLLVLAISAAVRAFRLVVVCLGAVLGLVGLVGPVVMYPVNVAFNFLVSFLLAVGLPLRILVVANISFLAIIAMTILAWASSDEAEFEALLDDLEEQE